jgi:hypothetical protein
MGAQLKVLKIALDVKQALLEMSSRTYVMLMLTNAKKRLIFARKQ